jgi:hypothetical protein
MSPSQTQAEKVEHAVELARMYLSIRETRNALPVHGNLEEHIEMIGLERQAGYDMARAVNEYFGPYVDHHDPEMSEEDRADYIASAAGDTDEELLARVRASLSGPNEPLLQAIREDTKERARMTGLKTVPFVVEPESDSTYTADLGNERLDG